MCDSTSTTKASSASSIIVSMNDEDDYLSDNSSCDSRMEKEMDAANMLSSLRMLTPRKLNEESLRPAPSGAGDRQSKWPAAHRPPASSTATLCPAATLKREMSMASTTSASSLNSSSSNNSDSNNVKAGLCSTIESMGPGSGSDMETKSADLQSIHPTAFKPGGKWTSKEDEQLRKGVTAVGECNWDTISTQFLHSQRSAIQCSHRWQKVLRPGLVKGPWTQEEDDIIVVCRQNGVTEWKEIALRLEGRLGKQCRDRWLNHLDPAISKHYWTEEEDKVLAEGRRLYGNAWAKIAKLLPGRPENSIKNRWYSARRAQERSFVAPPRWDLKFEKKVISDFCASFRKEEVNVDDILAHIIAVLRVRDPAAYSPSLAHINRQKLQRRLTAGLKREAAKYQPDSDLRQALRRAKLVQQKGGSWEGLAARRLAEAPNGPVLASDTSQGPAIPSSSSSTSHPALPLSASPCSSSFHPPPPPGADTHMSQVMILLQDALRAETDSGRRELLQQAVSATVQSNRAAVNYVEGILGGGFAKLDLQDAGDRASLVEALTSAVRRGLFVS